MDLGNKRIVVTGGAGFLGRHVCRELAHTGCSQVLVPRSSDYDLRRRDDVERMFQDLAPEIVIHMAAAVGGIGANREQPGPFFYENLIMGAEVLERARLHGLEKFVGVGTVCAYPRLTPVPFREEDLWNGYPEETNAPYGLAKKMLLVQGQAYREQYGFNAIHVLPTNVYGPGDSHDLERSHVIPALILKCLAAQRSGADSIEVWGSGEASRDFLYVEDCARAIVEATRSWDQVDPVNIGTGRETTIRELVDLVSRLCGFEGDVVWNTSKPDGQPRRCLDVSRAREGFGFEATVRLEEGLRETIDWYRTSLGAHIRPDAAASGG